MLYHGSVFGGLEFIKANSKSHSSEKMVAYFTEDRCYALICCRQRTENFVTMGMREDGKQHYFERFPNQLKTLYGGKRGFLYIIDDIKNLQKTTGHTWESETDISVQLCEVINDVYVEVLKEEAIGSIVIHRYAEIDPAEQKLHANYIKEHLDDECYKEIKQLLIAHFSTLWD